MVALVVLLAAGRDRVSGAFAVGMGGGISVSLKASSDWNRARFRTMSFENSRGP